MYVLLLVVLLASGQVTPMIRGGPDNPEIFKTVEACERQLKEDDKSFSEDVRRQGFSTFKWSCMLKDDYELLKKTQK